MLKELKKLLKNKDDKELGAAENDFDELMKKVDEDELVLEKLEKHVREEFDEIDDDVESISKKIDEVVEKETAPVGK